MKHYSIVLWPHIKPEIKEFNKAVKRYSGFEFTDSGVNEVSCVKLDTVDINGTLITVFGEDK